MATQGNQGNPEEAAVEQALAEVVRQVKQQSEALQLHFTHHEDFDAAREQAEQNIERSTTALEEAQQQALVGAVQELETNKSDLLELLKAQAADELSSQIESALQTISENYQTAIANAKENLTHLHKEHRQQLSQDYQNALENALTTNQRERDQQRTDFEQLSEQAIADLRSALDIALEASSKEYQTSLANAVANLTRLQVEQEQRLQQDYQKSLDNAFAINRQEREEQRSESEKLRDETVADLTSNLERAMEANTKEYQVAIAQATESLNAEQQRNNETIVAAIDTRWSKFSRILVGATVISTAVAIAAIMVALL